MSFKRDNITYRNGFTVKPYEITSQGQVLFTDGTTNDLIPNKTACEAYGYTYDQNSQTCRLNQQHSVQLNTNMQEVNMIKTGLNNTCYIGSNYGLIGGTDNQIQGMSRNDLVFGSENIVTNEINNATVLGVRGNATRQSEFVIGGGKNKLSKTDEDGDTTNTFTDRQFSIVELSGVSTSNAAINLTVNGDGSSFINVKNNTILGYELYLTRLEVGGSAGTAGDFSYRNQKGVVQIDNNYAMDIIVGFTRNIGKVGGVNGTFSLIDSSTTDVKSLSIQCSDRNNVTNVWSAVVYLHELISTNVTF